MCGVRQPFLAQNAGSWNRPATDRRLPLAIGRVARRAERSPLVESVLGEALAPAGLDLLELTEYAWHDCYGEITPPDEVILNILTCSEGSLATMIRAARLAVVDSRDLQLWAERIRPKTIRSRDARASR